MKDLYIEPLKEELLGPFLLEENIPADSHKNNKERDQSTSFPSSKKATKNLQTPPRSKAISSFLEKSRIIKSNKRQVTIFFHFTPYKNKIKEIRIEFGIY